MRIEVTHALGQAEAARRLDSFLDDLMRRDMPAGVQVKDPRKSWAGPRMDLSFVLAKGIFDTRIAGTLDVSGDRVVLEAAVPGIVTAFVGEAKVRAAIERELRGVLDGGGEPG